MRQASAPSCHLELLLFLKPHSIALSMGGQTAVLCIDALSGQVDAASKVFVCHPKLVLSNYLQTQVV